jgi:hypothetical protein
MPVLDTGISAKPTGMSAKTKTPPVCNSLGDYWIKSDNDVIGSDHDLLRRDSELFGVSGTA